MGKSQASLVCPFCDELTKVPLYSNKLITPHRIYIPRECIMGHKFYSVEYIPEDQSAIEDEIEEIRKNAREWGRTVRNSKKRPEESV